MANFTVADRVGGIGGYIGGIATLLGMLGNGYGAMPAAAAPGAPSFVTKDELTMAMTIAGKDSEIAMLKSEQNTEVKIADVYERLITRINADRNAQMEWNATQSVNNAQMSSAIAVNANSIGAIQGILGQITKTVIPNSSVCPGWGEVTVKPATTTTSTT